MNLTIDANILVSEVDSETGMAQSLLLHPTFEAVYIAEYTWNEAMYVLDRRFAGWVRGGRLAQDIADDVLRGTIAVFASLCTVIPETTYTIYEREARMRIPGDPDDWHTVALALTTDTAIWSLDQKHFFGCGMAVWNTRVLRAVLTAGER
ncbi:MAG: PIN domain-containing protein [Thermomicrobiales bacterium]